MNNHPAPRRSVSVGSILLTPQENECLLGYLGRKCTVSSSTDVPISIFKPHSRVLFLYSPEPSLIISFRIVCFHE